MWIKVLLLCIINGFVEGIIAITAFGLNSVDDTANGFHRSIGEGRD